LDELPLRVRRNENAKDVPLATYRATTSRGAGEVIEYCLFYRRLESKRILEVAAAEFNGGQMPRDLESPWTRLEQMSI
jgi:hypothetical protein